MVDRLTSENVVGGPSFFLGGLVVGHLSSTPAQCVVSEPLATMLIDCVFTMAVMPRGKAGSVLETNGRTCGDDCSAGSRICWKGWAQSWKTEAVSPWGTGAHSGAP